MKTRIIPFLLALLLTALSAKAATFTLMIAGETAVENEDVNTELLSQYGMTFGTKTLDNVTYPALTLNNSEVHSSAIGMKYSYSSLGSMQPISGVDFSTLCLIVNGICVIESTGSDGLLAASSSVTVMGSGSLYIKGTKGVNLDTQTSTSLKVGRGVELICEGTSGAGILGSPHPNLKNQYLGIVEVGTASTSLVVKGSTYAMAALSGLSMNSGAAIQYPSGLSFSNHGLNTTEWVHITAEGMPINSTYFPDAVFRNFVSQNYDTHEHDGYLSRYERSLVKTMNVYQKNISDLTGVNYFTSLTSLNCGANSYAAIDISNLTKLENLQCYTTGLRSIDLSHNTKLKTVDLRHNSLTALNVSNNTKLTELKCGSNFIDTLDVSMCPDLVSLEINGGTNVRMLTSLNIEGCTKLEDLNCGCGKLTSLDVSGCTALTRLQCDYNTLTTLNVARLTNLYFLQCSVNNLTSLDLTGCTGLELLYCGNNPIAQLNLSDCSGLKRLACRNNSKLTQLDVSGKQLTDLDCFNCPLLTSIDCSNNQLEANVPINVNRCNALREIRCQRNKLSEAALDTLISDLPTITTEGTIYLIDEDNNDENVCTDERN